MSIEQIITPLMGGILIGLAVTIMLVANGRVTGISGIINGAMKRVEGDTLWRVAFISGLISGGLVLFALKPGVFENTTGLGFGQIVTAGFIVGFGTILGSGCTSGHGVCGISRLSPRSLVATITFMFFGVVAVAVVRALTGGAI